MKSLIKISVLFIAIILASCTDVIDVPLRSAPARLVIEASLDWEKGTTGNEQSISLSISTPYFDITSNTAVIGASVTVTNDTSGTIFTFADQNTGEYTTSDFVPVLGQSYTLVINNNGETYTANETLNAVPKITEIYQAREDGFDEDFLEVHVVFTDPQEEENNYFFKFHKFGELLPELEAADDEFVNGNEIDWWYEIEADEETEKVEEFVSGDVVTIEMYAVSTPYKDYIEILINQTEAAGLFDSTPVALKGNCINETNPENYAHGFFRLTEVNKTSYTFE